MRSGSKQPNILIVDDSEVVLTALEMALSQCCILIRITKARSHSEALEMLEHNEFDVAIVDIMLPDALLGEAVDSVSEKGIPVIVLTGSSDVQIKELVRQKNIFEFVSKNQQDNIRYVATLAKRIIRNYETNVLVVDDSATVRMQIVKVLKKMRINVLEAVNPLEALKLIRTENIQLVLTDYEMPQMNGLDFVFKLREEYRKDQLMVIAISAVNRQDIVTQFLRHGANDYIHKPFSEDELQVRILEKLNMLDMIFEVQDKANRDFLTGLYNRRYFYEAGEPIFKKSRRRGNSLALVVFDIDHFKKINDTYGHDIGDMAIRQMGQILFDSFRTSDLIARFGGEEFCVLLEDISLEACQKLMEKIRLRIETSPLQIGMRTIPFTASVGVCYGLSETLDAMIKTADLGLYAAKEGGRNRVIVNTSFPSKSPKG